MSRRITQISCLNVVRDSESYTSRAQFYCLALCCRPLPAEISHFLEQRFRWIPPGTAHIGSPESERERYDDEVRYTRTTQGFWFAETTCTQAFWHAVMGDRPSGFEGDSLPVEQVSWEDIQERFLPSLCEQLNGITFRLPSEVEWEYACRAGGESAFQ